MSATETPYVETEALLAVMNQDHGLARSILEDFLPGELIMFQGQVGMLADLIRQVRRERAR